MAGHLDMPKQTDDEAKFKAPKLPATLAANNQPQNKLSTKPKAIKVTSTNTSDNSKMSEYLPLQTAPTTNQSSVKPPLKEEYATTDASMSTKGPKQAFNKNSVSDRPADGYSLTTSPQLNTPQLNGLQLKVVPTPAASVPQPVDNKKRINLMKKTTVVQELENMQAQVSEPSGKQGEQNFELGLVPIDIYTTSDYETAEQIVEARGYMLQERIGSGAFANVYKAWHVTEQIFTACKIIELKKKKKKRLNDLKHELYVLDKMDHVNIIKMYEHFLVDEKVYIFLEYASCGTLSEYVRKRGPLKDSRARKWFKQICSGLYHMHSNAVSHRDLKLGNILIDEYRNLKITDFGLSRVSYREGHGIFYCTSYAGTESYMAPEVIKKDEFGKRLYDPLAADIWALGVCLYAMVNKAYPFNPEDKDRMVANQMQRKWKFVKKQRTKLSNELKDLVRHLLEPDPKRRITFLGIVTHAWMNESEFEKQANQSSSLVRASVSTSSLSGTNESHFSKLANQVYKL